MVIVSSLWNNMLTFVQKCMAQNIFKLVLTDEAQNFIESLPEAVSYKIYYNIKRVAGGERNKELFKKLENVDSNLKVYHP